VVRPPLKKAGYTNAADSVRSIQPRDSQEKKNDLISVDRGVHTRIVIQAAAERVADIACGKPTSTGIGYGDTADVGISFDCMPTSAVLGEFHKFSVNSA
jgi:hypothetical protein